MQNMSSEADLQDVVPEFIDAVVIEEDAGGTEHEVFESG